MQPGVVTGIASTYCQLFATRGLLSATGPLTKRTHGVPQSVSTRRVCRRRGRANGPSGLELASVPAGRALRRSSARIRSGDSRPFGPLVSAARGHRIAERRRQAGTGIRRARLRAGPEDPHVPPDSEVSPEPAFRRPLRLPAWGRLNASFRHRRHHRSSQQGVLVTNWPPDSKPAPGCAPLRLCHYGAGWRRRVPETMRQTHNASASRASVATAGGSVLPPVISLLPSC
jgi:hypothetical protein